MIAKNKCCNIFCGYEWEDQPGAFNTKGLQCPRCGYKYFKWLNYEPQKDS